MYSEYIRQLLQDYKTLSHIKFMRKYKPSELIKARKIYIQDNHARSVDNRI